MNELEEIKLAEQVAVKAHKGQFRKGPGETPYIIHPARVVSKLYKNGRRTRILAVGWLHDVIEDTDVTLNDLIELGFSRDVYYSVFALTKPKGGDYKEYLKLIKGSGWTLRVKIADIIDNLNDYPTDKQIKKYGEGLAYLLS